MTEQLFDRMMVEMWSQTALLREIRDLLRDRVVPTQIQGVSVARLTEISPAILAKDAPTTLIAASKPASVPEPPRGKRK